MNNLKKFPAKSKLDDQIFVDSEISSEVLNKIYEHYLAHRESFLPTAKFIAEELNNAPHVHSIKYRLKDPARLLDKVIRKKKSHPELKIDETNYQNIITDIIGVRAIHLFKQDWVHIHDFILNQWDLNRSPKAYISCTTSEELIRQYQKQGIEVRTHPFGYQSIHYLIEFKNGKSDRIVELQVRTILEEVWGEIDHEIRYPRQKVEPHIEEYLKIFNGFIDQLDRMGELIRKLKNGEGNTKAR